MLLRTAQPPLRPPGRRDGHERVPERGVLHPDPLHPGGQERIQGRGRHHQKWTKKKNAQKCAEMRKNARKSFAHFENAKKGDLKKVMFAKIFAYFLRIPAAASAHFFLLFFFFVHGVWSRWHREILDDPEGGSPAPGLKLREVHNSIYIPTKPTARHMQ